MRTITINGVTYKAQPFTFNTICEFEDKGISLQELANKPMGMIRTYVAMCTKMDVDLAGEQMEQHIINGGSFDEIMEVINEEMNESGFFRALNKTEEKATTTSKKKTAQ